jgi:peptidoglycan-associated lipoprotein
MRAYHFKLVTIICVAAGLFMAGCAKKEMVLAPNSNAGQTQGIGQAQGLGQTQGQVQGLGQNGQPVQLGEGKPSSVYFEFNQSGLNEDAQTTLNADATWLNANLGVNIIVEGNCDQRGTREYNLALGQRRADTVRDYLEQHGVAAKRIDTVSYGKERPRCNGTGPACWAQNRRADIGTR